MKTAQDILDKHFPQYYFEKSNNDDILMAMEGYAQYKVNELNKSDVIKSVCDVCKKEFDNTSESNLFCDECWKVI